MHARNQKYSRDDGGPGDNFVGGGGHNLYLEILQFEFD